MVYTNHLWWLGGWFIIAIPTLFVFASPQGRRTVSLPHLCEKGINEGSSGVSLCLWDWIQQMRNNFKTHIYIYMYIVVQSKSYLCSYKRNRMLNGPTWCQWNSRSCNSTKYGWIFSRLIQSAFLACLVLTKRPDPTSDGWTWFQIDM